MNNPDSSGGPAPAELLRAYEDLVQTTGLVDLTARTRIRLAGSDCQSFLNNLCTNDIQRLLPGTGCEAFVTNVQGKCVGHIGILVDDEGVLVETVPGQVDTLLPHWDRYLITEDVEMSDVSSLLGELLVAGDQAEGVLQQLFDKAPPRNAWEHRRDEIDGKSCQLVRVPWLATDVWLLLADRQSISFLSSTLLKAGAQLSCVEAVEMARIEYGYPAFGQDISPTNLPQEVNRDEQAISFTKGCYLGQETVARLDALGHVNKVLSAVRCDQATVPATGTEISVEGRSIGAVTSSAFSPKLGQPLALAYLRCPHNEPGTKVQVADAPGQVVALPVVA